MRRSEGSGEKEFRGATEVIWARMESRDDGWKRWRSCRSVISRVFVGGVGRERGGRLDRSRDREGRDEEREERLALKEGDEGCERGGELVSCILAC